MNYLTSGLEDLIKSFKDHLRWLSLGYLDIKLRYRRSIIGPIWNTINIGLIIFVLSLIWPEIISIDKNFFVPYFTIGYILWFWINTIIYESINAFLEFEAIYKQIIVPTYSIFLRIWFRNLIILAHNIIIILLVFLWFDSSYLENFNLFHNNFFLFNIFWPNSCFSLSKI